MWQFIDFVEILTVGNCGSEHQNVSETRWVGGWWAGVGAEGVALAGSDYSNNLISLYLQLKSSVKLVSHLPIIWYEMVPFMVLKKNNLHM
jgi:hypothetical protein